MNQMKGVQSDRKRYVPNPDPCIDDYVQKYLNTPTVQQAIHALPTSWIDCGGPSYSFNHESQIPYYHMYMNSTNYRLWVYSGDADTVINFIGTEKWVYDLRRPVQSKWNSWSYSRVGASPQLGGWKVRFDRLTFVTIKGAGHMAPWFQPAPSLQFFKDFLAGQ